MIFFVSFLWPSHLDRSVNCERKDAKEEAVEHAEDWGATVVRVLLGTWEKVILVTLEPAMKVEPIVSKLAKLIALSPPSNLSNIMET